jgi:hypothetical protein
MEARYVIFPMVKHQLPSLKQRSVIVPCNPLFLAPLLSAVCHYTAFYLQSLTVYSGCCIHTAQTGVYLDDIHVCVCLSVCICPLISVEDKKVLIQFVHPRLTKVCFISVVFPCFPPYVSQCVWLLTDREKG